MPGINGRVDMNKLLNESLLYGTDAISEKKTNEEIAQEVIDGKWGNGQERKDRLRAAGYSYEAVQDCVNKLLSKKTIADIAQEVIDGKWGNGQDRKNRLKAAGYNPATVQKAVNKLMR